MRDALYLTFDDGPDPEFTPLVLAALAARDARATFFVLGAAVRRSPETIVEILRGGHRVELHGDAHLDHRAIDTTMLAVDTGRALMSLQRLGIAPSWWRLPWGRPGPATGSIARRTELRIVGWDLDTHDWRGDGWNEQPPARLDRVAAGGVVLLHDGVGPGASRTTIDNTLELIDGLADLAAARDLAMLALPAPGEAAAARITGLPDGALVAPGDPSPAAWNGGRAA